MSRLELRELHTMEDLEARRIHGIPVWCGGMLETGIGRAANVALARCPASPSPGTPLAPTATSPRTSPTRSSSARAI